jgi:hypothetical protein
MRTSINNTGLEVNDHVSLKWPWGSWDSNWWSLGSKLKAWPVELHPSMLSFIVLWARVVQYKDQPNLKMLHILLQSLLRVTIMRLKTSTALRIDTSILLSTMKLLLILSPTPKSLASILCHFSFHDITSISLISHMSLTKKLRPWRLYFEII